MSRFARVASLVAIGLSTNLPNAFAQEASQFQIDIRSIPGFQNVDGFARGHIVDSRTQMLATQTPFPTLFTIYNFITHDGYTFEFGIAGGVIPKEELHGLPDGAFRQIGSAHQPDPTQPAIVLLRSSLRRTGTVNELSWGHGDTVYVGGVLPMIQPDPSTGTLQIVQPDYQSAIPLTPWSFVHSDASTPPAVTPSLIGSELKDLGIREVSK